MSLSSETDNYEHIKELNNRKVPIVFFDRVYNDMYAAKITTNDYHSGIMGTNHLIEMGCKKIAFLGFSKNSIASINRNQGFVDTLQKNNFEVDESLIIDCTSDFNANFSLISDLLKKKKRVDGIFSSAESLALITYQICNELGIKIPKELKLLSFSNMQTASFLNPSLATITQPAFDMGKEAAEVLFKTIEKPNVDYRDVEKVLKSNLLIRNSTGK